MKKLFDLCKMEMKAGLYSHLLKYLGYLRVRGKAFAQVVDCPGRHDKLP